MPSACTEIPSLLLIVILVLGQHVPEHQMRNRTHVSLDMLLQLLKSVAADQKKQSFYTNKTTNITFN
jgi:hypothetical protein